MNLKIFNNIDENTGIDWWDANRKKVNYAINLVNSYTRSLKYDELTSKLIITELEACQRFLNDNDGSEWQADILNELKQYVEEEIGGVLR